tara:strand:+ start:264370 stop:264864 length:495 start_codon:yes stop_codon:yes gene_type:complete
MSYTIPPISELDSEDLSALYNAVADYAQNVSDHIEHTPQLKEFFDKIYDDMGEMSTLDEAFFTCGIERIFGAKDSAQKEEKAAEQGQYEQIKAQIHIDEILYYDLYIKTCLGDAWDQKTIRMAPPSLHKLLPASLHAAEKLELCRKVGAHNIADIIALKTPTLN